jgi:hypothetical protein
VIAGRIYNADNNPKNFGQKETGKPAYLLLYARADMLSNYTQNFSLKGSLIWI